MRGPAAGETETRLDMELETPWGVAIGQTGGHEQMPNQIDVQIQKLVDAFASELGALYRQVATHAVEDALRGHGRAPRGGRTRQAERSAKKARALRGREGASEMGFHRRSPEEIEALQGRLYREIRKKGGRRIEEIADSMGEETRHLTLPMKKLISEKKIKTAGQKRATRYSAA